MSESTRCPESEGDKLLHLAFREYKAGDYEKVLSHATLSLELFRELHDYGGIYASLYLLGITETGRNRNDLARARFEECLAIAKAYRNERDVAGSLLYLSLAEQLANDYDGARKSLHKARSIFEKLGDQSGIMMTLHNLAMIELKGGNRDEGGRLYNESRNMRKSIERKRARQRGMRLK